MYISRIHSIQVRNLFGEEKSAHLIFSLIAHWRRVLHLFGSNAHICQGSIKTPQYLCKNACYTPTYTLIIPKIGLCTYHISMNSPYTHIQTHNAKMYVNTYKSRGTHTHFCFVGILLNLQNEKSVRKEVRRKKFIFYWLTVKFFQIQFEVSIFRSI